MANAILLALAPIFFVLALGYGAGRLRIRRQPSCRRPQCAGHELRAAGIAVRGDRVGPAQRDVRAGAALRVLGAVMLVAVPRLVLGSSARSSGRRKADASLQALTIAFPNLAGVGLPIMSAVLGPSGTVPVAVALAAARSSSARSR